MTKDEFFNRLYGNKKPHPQPHTKPEAYTIKVVALPSRRVLELDNEKYPTLAAAKAKVLALVKEAGTTDFEVNITYLRQGDQYEVDQYYGSMENGVFYGQDLTYPGLESITVNDFAEWREQYDAGCRDSK